MLASSVQNIPTILIISAIDRDDQLHHVSFLFSLKNLIDQFSGLSYSFSSFVRVQFLCRCACTVELISRVSKAEITPRR